MSSDRTITEHDLDANSRDFLQGMDLETGDFDPDLAVDGLSDSVLSRLLGLFGIGRS